jgi:hypothetical protein
MLSLVHWALGSNPCMYLLVHHSLSLYSTLLVHHSLSLYIIHNASYIKALYRIVLLTSIYKELFIILT